MEPTGQDVVQALRVVISYVMLLGTTIFIQNPGDAVHLMNH